MPGCGSSLRPTGIDPPYEVFGVTADPAEGEGWTETGTDLVEVVAMPEPIRATIEAFVAEHHVDRPFYQTQTRSCRSQRVGPSRSGSRGTKRVSEDGTISDPMGAAEARRRKGRDGGCGESRRER